MTQRTTTDIVELAAEPWHQASTGDILQMIPEAGEKIDCRVQELLDTLEPAGTMEFAAGFATAIRAIWGDVLIGVPAVSSVGMQNTISAALSARTLMDWSLR